MYNQKRNEWRDRVLERLFGKGKVVKEPIPTPEAFMPEDPVNYNSVLDYLVGLSKSDYTKMIKSAEIYREANAKVAKVIGVKDEPTTALRTEKPEITDDDLDLALEHGLEFMDDDLEVEKPKKPQATDKKVEIKE